MTGQRFAALVLLILLLISGTSCAVAVPIDTLTPLPPTETPTLPLTDLPTPTPSATPSPLPTSTPTGTPTLTSTPTRVPTATPTAIIKRTVSDVACPSSSELARQAFNDGINYESQGNYDQAKASYQAALGFDGNYCDAMDNLAALLRREGRLDDAIAFLRRSIGIAPYNVTAHLNLGLYYQLQGKVDDAIAEYKRAIEIDPNNPEGYFGLGSVYIDLRQPELAIVHLEKARNLYMAAGSPLITDANYYLGLGHFMSRHFVQARDYFELAYPKMSDNPSLNYYLGTCYLAPEIANLDMARKYLNHAQELGMPISAEVRALLQNATPMPTLVPASNPPTSTPAARAVPLPTGQPVSIWNDIPIMPQAISGSEDKGVYSYTVKMTMQQVVDFYTREMPKQGWSIFATGGSSVSNILMFQKAGKAGSIFVLDQPGLVVVMLVLS